MKTIQDQLEKILKKLKEEIEAREFDFDVLSESWENSESEKHQEKTDKLIQTKENLELPLDNISEFLEL